MPSKVSRKPADVFRRFGLTQDTAVTRIVRRIDSATEEQLQRGAEWYSEAHEFAALLALAGGHDITATASAIAHLSPQTMWRPNISFATAACLGETERPAGCMSRNWERALAALASPDPLATFNTSGEGDGQKTANFARNILGDEDAVTVDVWAARIIGVDEEKLGNAGAYGACAHAYRLAGKRLGMSPRCAQATAWVAISDQRGKYRARKTH